MNSRWSFHLLQCLGRRGAPDNNLLFFKKGHCGSSSISAHACVCVCVCLCVTLHPLSLLSPLIPSLPLYTWSLMNPCGRKGRYRTFLSFPPPPNTNTHHDNKDLVVKCVKCRYSLTSSRPRGAFSGSGGLTGLCLLVVHPYRVTK